MSEAPNSRTGLAVAEVQRPDLILMDVMMEERTEGFFALQQLRRSPALMHIPVFVVSSIYSSIPGFGIDPSHSWLRHDDFIAKPVDLTALLARIETRLAAAPAHAGACA